MRRTGTQSARLLLVEGSSDKRIVQHICKAYADLPSFDIHACGGWSGLRVEIRQQLGSSKGGRCSGLLLMRMVTDSGSGVR